MPWGRETFDLFVVTVVAVGRRTFDLFVVVVGRTFDLFAVTVVAVGRKAFDLLVVVVGGTFDHRGDLGCGEAVEGIQHQGSQDVELGGRESLGAKSCGTFQPWVG